MVNTRRTFLPFLLDMMSGLCYKEGSDRMIRKVNPLTGEECALPEAPEGWDEMQLSFGRNTHYWALNRAFSNTFKFVGAGARILRSLLYAGKGTESNVMLIICKWDDTTGVYRLYYSGQIDFGKDGDQVADGITVATLEGGVAGMIKSMENSVFEIECDGSIPENLKVNVDGILFDDVFHYQIVPFTLPFPGEQILPATFISNDGDNIDVTKGSPTLEQLTTGYFQRSPNCVISFGRPTKYNLSGSITVKSAPTVHNTSFYMYAATSKTVPIGTGVSHAQGLVGPGKIAADNGQWNANQQLLDGQRLFNFEISGELDTNERLYIPIFNNFAEFPISVIGGNFDVAFSSRYKASRVTGMTMWDLFRLIMQRMYAKHLAIGGPPINFGVQSDLLQSRLNVVVTSGDAARASTDPNYFQYYNQATLNPANPNNQDYNQFPSLGPVIKSNLSDLFDTNNALSNACLGVKKVDGKDVVFLEEKKVVFNPSVITMSLDKVANLKVSVALDYYFNWIKAGYEEQKYDEKAGKYEYNSASQWQAPIRSIAKVLELISKYRADSYGFEYTRWNTQGGKSSTYNGSDSSVFMLDTDFSKFILNYYSALFQAQAPDPATGVTDDIIMVPNQAFQSITLTTFDGEYFVTNIDFSIFIFNQDMISTLFNTRVKFSALLNGLAGDSATITMFLNGAPLRTWSQIITGINTALTIDETFARFYNTGDNLYFAVDTVRTCTVEITAFEIVVGDGYWSATNAGSTVIPASSTQKLISLPTITATLVAGLPVVSSGFQYFRFLSNVTNKNFAWTLMIAGYTQGAVSENVRFDLWKNGQKIGTDTFFGTGARVQFNPLKSVLFNGNLAFENNDLIWITASPTNMHAWVSDGELRFTSQIKAYYLLREAFDSVTGIPNPETAYNIAFTPGRILRANGSLISPVVFNQSPGVLSFQTSDKNPFLSTSKDGLTISERANIDVHDLDSPLFWPFYIEFDTEVPINFADLLYGQANGHIEVLWGEIKLYGFPIQVTSKPAYNEAQSWKLLLSPRSNLSDLKNLDWDGLIPLQPMDSLVPFLSPVHFVPLDYQKADGDDTFTMDEDWFKNRYATWLDNNDFFNPWQQDDTLSFQFQAYNLDPVKIQVLDGDGNYMGAAIAVPNIPTAALPPNQKLYGLDLALSTFDEGQYYFIVTFGIGEGMASWISEPIWVKEKWENTLRFKYKHSRNLLGTVFTEGYNPMFRTHGKITRFTPKSKRTQLVDQPQDVVVTGAVPYRTWKLQIGHEELVPDYVTDLMDEIMDLDTVLIDGNQYTRNAEDDWEYQTFPGQPKVIGFLNIRKAKNSGANILNTAGQLTSDMSGGYTLDPAAFGQSIDGQDLVNVQNS